MEKIIEIKGLKVEYRTERATSRAVNGIDLSIGVGESIGLVGETGAGKTTTALSMLNLLPTVGHVTGGDILYKGESIFAMSERQLMDLRGNKIAMIFQNPLTSLNPVFTVGEQIAMVLRRHKQLGRREALKEAGNLLESVGIPRYRLKDYPVQFSGGMRQRVGIAAGIACSTDLLIADEPTTALDVTIQAQIIELMKKLQKEYATSLLMITHNLGIISELCEKVAVMYAGRIIEFGTVREVFYNPMHPYTRGLLGAIPKLTKSREPLKAIKGTIANPQDLPTGCYFHPRCDQMRERCACDTPGLLTINEDHSVACFFEEGEV